MMVGIDDFVLRAAIVAGAVLTFLLAIYFTFFKAELNVSKDDNGKHNSLCVVLVSTLLTINERQT